MTIAIGVKMAVRQACVYQRGTKPYLSDGGENREGKNG